MSEEGEAVKGSAPKTGTTTSTKPDDDFPITVSVLADNPGRKSNVIKTAKYNALTFLPATVFHLLNPFERFANFYFLVVGLLQMVPAISVTGSKYFGDIWAATVWQTLLFMMVVDIILAAKEELQKHRSDRQTNGQQVAMLPPGGGPLRMTTWADVSVGAVVKVYAREHFPADLLLLRGSDPPGQCWANTKPLDGETDTKLRLAPKGVANLLATLGEADVAVAEGVRSTTSPYVNKMRELLKGAYVVCEAPNDKVGRAWACTPYAARGVSSGARTSFLVPMSPPFDAHRQVNDFSGQLYLPGEEPQILAR